MSTPNKTQSTQISSPSILANLGTKNRGAIAKVLVHAFIRFVFWLAHRPYLLTRTSEFNVGLLREAMAKVSAD